ncbi:MAG: sigma-70 family RNA polymerase sigma factor [Opitutales bacterium]
MLTTSPAKHAAGSPVKNEPTLAEAVCRRVIVAYRNKLEFILMIPEWEPIFLEGLKELNLPGPRKGIGLRPALNALLIENKYELIRWAIIHYRHLFQSSHATRVERKFSLDLFSSLDLDEHLTGRQWMTFKETLLFALGKEHRKYKRAQGLLFFSYKALIESTVNRSVFDPGKRLDAVQEGCLALLHAIDKADDSKTPLGAYAQMWIKRQVKNYLLGERFPVHVPINLASKTLTRQSEKADPAAGETATEKKTAILMESLRQPSVSLNHVVGDAPSLMEQLTDEFAENPRTSIAQKDLRELVSELIHNLTEKQREVLEMRFGLNGHQGESTLTQISRKIGISHQQVSMREKRALQKLESALSPYIKEIFE